MRFEGRQELDQAFDELERRAPARVARGLRWFRQPERRWIRIPLGLFLILQAPLAPFLPILAIEFAPIGLLLLAQDVPFLRGPSAKLVFWLLRRWDAVRRWWTRKGRHPR